MATPELTPSKRQLRRHATPQPIPAEQAAKIKALLAAIQDSLASKPDLVPWCSDSTLARYLRARKWDVLAATKMLKNSLEWRIKYKPHEITWEDVKEEAKTGKTFLYDSTDKEGRPIVIIRPRCENTRNTEKQIQHLVYNLELASRHADASGVGKMTWLIDFVGYTMRNAPSPKVAVQTLGLLQNHYPERLGLAVCYRPPRLFQLTWRACSPFIDPITYRKIYFVDNNSHGGDIMTEKFDMDGIEACMGGGSAFEFDPEVYGRQREKEEAVARRSVTENALLLKIAACDLSAAPPAENGALLGVAA